MLGSWKHRKATRCTPAADCGGMCGPSYRAHTIVRGDQQTLDGESVPVCVQCGHEIEPVPQTIQLWTAGEILPGVELLAYSIPSQPGETCPRCGFVGAGHVHSPAPSQEPTA